MLLDLRRDKSPLMVDARQRCRQRVTELCLRTVYNDEVRSFSAMLFRGIRNAICRRNSLVLAWFHDTRSRGIKVYAVSALKSRLQSLLRITEILQVISVILV